MIDEELKKLLEERGVKDPELSDIIAKKPADSDLELFFERIKAQDANIRREALEYLLKAIPSDKQFTEKDLRKEGRDFRLRERRLSQRQQMELFYPTGGYKKLSPDLDHETLNAVLFINAKTKATQNRRIVFTKSELLREIGYPEDQIRRGGSIWQKAEEVMDKLWNNEWRFEGRGRKGEMREYKLRIITGVSRPQDRTKGGEYEVILNFDLAPHISMLKEGVGDVSLLKGEYVTIPEKVRKDRSGNWRSLELWLQSLYGMRPVKIKCENLLLKAGVSRSFVRDRKKESFDKVCEILGEMKNKGFLHDWDLHTQQNVAKYKGDTRKWTISLLPQKAKKKEEKGTNPSRQIEHRNTLNL